jgi:NAD(P)H-hydrate epimerase
MSLLLTAAQMRAVDGAVINQLGLPGLVLMENAGRGVAELVLRERPNIAGLDVRVVCGAGQNGGDGFVVARHLLARGARVRTLLAMPPDKISGDAAVYLKVLRALPGAAIVDVSSTASAAVWAEHLQGAAVIVDALFGTGLRSDVSGVPAVAITAMNASPALRVAVDIPSGLDADTGEVRGIAVNADITATMGARKLGLVVRAEAAVGRIEVVDLGVSPESVLDAALELAPVCRWLDQATVGPVLPKRGRTGHKGTAGHLLAIAGSVGKTGAGLLCARAALRAGAGMVTIATTSAAQAAFDAKVVAEMTTCYSQGEDVDANSFADLSAQVARMKAVVVGPGIPTGEGMAALVRRLVAELPVPMVVDADGLNLLGVDAAEVVGKVGAPRVLTPHPGEMARLCGCSIRDVQNDRLGIARRLAAASGAVVVLKGARTIVATPDGSAYVNPTANAALGTAGSGDVLSGTIGAFLAQGLDAKDAACAGVFVHGAAADFATQTVGSHHLIATDLPDAIARACEALGSV